MVHDSYQYMIKDQDIAQAFELIQHEFASMEMYVASLEHAVDSLEIQLDQKYQENKELTAEISLLRAQLADAQDALAEVHLTDSR